MDGDDVMDVDDFAVSRRLSLAKRDSLGVWIGPPGKANTGATDKTARSNRNRKGSSKRIMKLFETVSR